MAEKSSPGTRQTDSKNLVWFGEIERKLAKLSMPTFTYRLSSSLFYGTEGWRVAIMTVLLVSKSFLTCSLQQEGKRQSTLKRIAITYSEST
jgi:hypothetical protein